MEESRKLASVSTRILSQEDHLTFIMEDRSLKKNQLKMAEVQLQQQH